MALGVGIGNIIVEHRTGDSAGFSPRDFGDLDIWYDFSKIVDLFGLEDDDNLSKFPNGGRKAGLFDLSQSTSSKMPHVSTDEMQLPSARFNNSASMQFELPSTYITTQKTFTIFAVVRVDDTSTSVTECLLAGETTGASQISSYNNRNITLRFNGAVASGSLNGALIQLIDSTGQDEYTGSSSESTVQYSYSTGDELFVIVKRADDEVRTFNKNGDLVGLSTAKSNNHSDTNMAVRYIGAFSNGNNAHDGTIGEIGIYDKDLTDTQAKELCAHLKSKWSIS